MAKDDTGTTLMPGLDLPDAEYDALSEIWKRRYEKYDDAILGYRWWAKLTDLDPKRWGPSGERLWRLLELLERRGLVTRHGELTPREVEFHQDFDCVDNFDEFLRKVETGESLAERDALKPDVRGR